MKYRGITCVTEKVLKEHPDLTPLSIAKVFAEILNGKAWEDKRDKCIAHWISGEI